MGNNTFKRINRCFKTPVDPDGKWASSIITLLRERTVALQSLTLHTMIGKSLIKVLSFHNKIIFLVKKLKIVKKYL